MKLSLSTRVAEAPKPRKDIALMPLPELARVAKNAGYRALCMRASQVGVQSSPQELKEARKVLDGMGLRVSMVSGNNDVPNNNDRVVMVLREIGKHLDVAEALGADLLRIGMKAHTDIPWARRACDEAAERGMRLAHQCHVCSLFETVEMSLQVVREVGRKNFGIIYEPSNLIVCGQDYGQKTIRALAPYMFNVYLQNWWNHPDGKITIGTWINGPVNYDLLPFGDPRGVDFRAVFAALAETGYDGYVTVHQVGTGMDIPTGVRQFADYLRSVASFE
ncbi:MAG: sugar phosphate isomerase/epimerase [Betaproteobacteria bacterium]|nr:sugar phosphate isomerase/epimerase [Betaproteobacteria bacterium]